MCDRISTTVNPADGIPDGRLRFSGLFPGQYVLVQTSSPAGFALAPNKIVTVRVDESALVSVTMPFAPGLVLSPTAASVGRIITATLTHFKPGEVITLTWSNGERRLTLATVTASSSGRATVTFKVGTATRGNHAVKAAGSKGSKATANLNIVPRIKLTPSSGPAGTRVNVALTGYAPGFTVEVIWYDGVSPKVVKTVTTSATGSATTSFTVPSSATLGEHKVEAKEHGRSYRATAMFALSG